MASAHAVLLLFIFILKAKSNAAPQNLIRLGSSLSPANEPHSWISPSRRFAFGFYQQGGGFLVNTVVWTANRDDPPVPSNAKLTLSTKGKLILTTDEEDKFIANTSEYATSAAMLDSGKFVLYNESFGIIWSSFESPTDTILGEQYLNVGFELVSSVSEFNSSSGRFRLKMQDDGNLVWYPINTIDEFTDAYWATDTNGYNLKQKRLYLNNIGDLVIIDSDMSTVKTLYYNNYASSDNDSIIYHAKLGHDGIFRLYSQYTSHEGEYHMSIKLQVPKDMCAVKTFCGLNSYCTLYDDRPMCRCLPGTDPVDPYQMYAGCERNFTDEGCKVSRGTYNMTSVEKMVWDDYAYLKEELQEEDCKTSCLEDCSCDAVLYKSGYCAKHKLPLKSARRIRELTMSYTAYFKTGLVNIKIDNGSHPTARANEPTSTGKKAIILIMVITLGFTTCSCVFLATSGYFVFKNRVLKYKRLLETGNYFGSKDELTLRPFSYSEQKKATNGFKDLLGTGAFGAVYKGAFRKGEKLVAVKRLEKIVKEGEKQFQAEMLVIGRTHHKNLVRLLGYCAEDSKRLVVYEYMSNGSLADLIFRSKTFPVWDERMRIALDIARGILYLHDECAAPIIHCDIKPQNILMDDDWTAKISDFGLAKLLLPDQTMTFTLVRGTRGYLAPEWCKNTPISVKADVYSYEVALLEIVCCRRNLELDTSKPDEMVLTNWVYKCFTERQLNRLVRGQEAEKMTLENMVKVGLWCVQDEPALRPSMKSVVMMLEGITHIAIPPCPTA